MKSAGHVCLAMVDARALWKEENKDKSTKERKQGAKYVNIYWTIF